MMFVVIRAHIPLLATAAGWNDRGGGPQAEGQIPRAVQETRRGMQSHVRGGPGT